MAIEGRNGYTGIQLEKALHAVRRDVSFRYDLLNLDNVVIGTIDTVRSAGVDWSAGNEIRRTAKLEMRDDPNINFLQDRLRPVMRLRMPDGGWAEWPLGVFLMTSPNINKTATSKTRPVDAYDMTLVLSEDLIESRYAVAAGSNIVEAVRVVLQDGLGDATPVSITSIEDEMPAAREWEPGTSRTQIANELLTMIGYDPVHFNADGEAVLRPFVEPQARHVVYRYATDRNSVIYPDGGLTEDAWSVPNKWVGRVSETDQEPLSSVFINDDETSLTSTVNRGREIVSILDVTGAANQTALDTIVYRRAVEDSQIFTSMSFSTALMPFHGDQDVLNVVFNDLDEGLYLEQSWGMDLTAGGVMTHTARKIVELLRPISIQEVVE